MELKIKKTGNKQPLKTFELCYNYNCDKGIYLNINGQTVAYFNADGCYAFHEDTLKEVGFLNNDNGSNN